MKQARKPPERTENYEVSIDCDNQVRIAGLDPVYLDFDEVLRMNFQLCDEAYSFPDPDVDGLSPVVWGPTEPVGSRTVLTTSQHFSLLDINRNGSPEELRYTFQVQVLDPDCNPLLSQDPTIIHKEREGSGRREPPRRREPMREAVSP